MKLKIYSGVPIAAIGITAGGYMGNLLGLGVEIIGGAMAIWILWPRAANTLQ